MVDRVDARLEDWFQHQLQRRLDHPVRHRRNPEAANLSRPTRFRDLAFPHRKRPERARLELGTQVVQEPRNPDLLLDIGDREAVHASSPGPGVARDPVKRHDQRRRVVHEVEQIVEPAARISRRPTVKFGLHLRYPPTRPRRDLNQRSATIRWCVFRHYSLLPFSKLLPPFPLCSGFPRLGVLRRLCPVSTRSVDDGPGPTIHAGDVGTGKSRDGSRVHCRFARRRRSPTLSLRHRHGYPVALHRGLPVSIHMPTSKFPAEPSDGYAPHPAHIHQIGAGEPLRDVVTLVPRVLLFVTLAEPTPSGSTGASRLCQGCSHPFRHLPEQAALSFTALLRHGQRRRSLTPTQIVSASRRTRIQA